MTAKWFLALSPLIGVALAYVILYASHVSRLKRIWAGPTTLPPDVKSALWSAVTIDVDQLRDSGSLTKLVVDLHRGYGDFSFGETKIVFDSYRYGLADEAIVVRVSGLLAFTVYWHIASMRHDIVLLDPYTTPRMLRWASLGTEVAPSAAPTIADQALTDAVLPLLRQKHEEFKVDFERAKAEIEDKIDVAKTAKGEQRDAVLSNLRTTLKEQPSNAI